MGASLKNKRVQEKEQREKEIVLLEKRIEDKGRNMEKELGNSLEDLPISLSLIPSIMFLLLIVSYASTYLSSHVLLEDSLLHSGSTLDTSCYDFRVKNNASIESKVVGFGLDGALFDILHDKCLVKFVEKVGYVSSFLDTLMENHNGFVSLNQLMSFVSGQVEFSCNEQKLSNVINSLNTLFENTFRFKFYHLHFKKFLLKDFENQMGTNLEFSKVNLFGI
ncbi:hypothetical protein M9H77_06945 [Catharanthus roseus]|uniref:Uncharacterized protein n=1 Tax=Catharanthus roseus TaxID=4058 RepID=A0ACC0BTH5_CATRO|nr:hypothetical protein M9H77_06945 [Catharanthus roseus]